MSRRSKRSKRSSRSRGGGYSVDVAHSVAVGYPVNAQYTGVGKDCPDMTSRPMITTSYGALPGMAGGRRRRGGYVPQAASTLTFAPVAAAAAAPPVQKGGRYGLVDGAPLDPSQAIGMSSYAPISRVPCEASRAMMGGASDMAAYYAPTAGYSHSFDASHGGLMLNTPYAAHASNPACKTTGGRRAKSRKGKSRKSRARRNRSLTRRRS